MKFSLFFSLNTFQIISTLTVILLCVIFVSFLFSNLLLTTEAMGIWRFAGAFTLSLCDKVNAGAKPAKCTSAANEHRRVLN